MHLSSRLALACMLAAPFAAAHASSITSATVYTGTPDPKNAADSANMASTLPQANFTIGSQGIDFVTNDQSASIATFLNNPTFSNPVNGFSSATPTNGAGGKGTELVINGTISLMSGDLLSIAHDDGATLTLNGVNVINSPGLTTLKNSSYTYTGPAATENFTLDYAECCGVPADLIFTDNGSIVGAPTPEPSSLALFGTGILGVYGAARRRFARTE